MPNGEKSKLNEQDRQKLDGIVAEMEANSESADDIQFVVEDFKSKYAVKKKEEPEPSFAGAEESASGAQSTLQQNKKLTGLHDPNVRLINPEMREMDAAISGSFKKWNEDRAGQELTEEKDQPIYIPEDEETNNTMRTAMANLYPEIMSPEGQQKDYQKTIYEYLADQSRDNPDVFTEITTKAETPKAYDQYGKYDLAEKAIRHKEGKYMEDLTIMRAREWDKVFGDYINLTDTHNTQVAAGNTEEAKATKTQIDELLNQENNRNIVDRFSDKINQLYGLQEQRQNALQDNPEVLNRLKNEERLKEMYSETWRNAIPGIEGSVQDQAGRAVWNSLVDAGIDFLDAGRLLTTASDFVMGKAPEEYTYGDLFIDKMSGFLENYIKVPDVEIPVFEDEKTNYHRIVPNIAKTATDMGLLLYGANKFTVPFRAAGMAPKAASSTGLISSSFVMTQGNYYQEAKERGLSEKEAFGYSIPTAAAVSVAEIISPNIPIRSMGKVAQESLEGYTKVVSKDKAMAARNAIRTFIREPFKENVQEFSQSAIEKASAWAANETYGLEEGRELEDKMTMNEVYETALLTTATTMLLGGATQYADPSAVRQSAMYELAKRYPEFEQYMNWQVENGEIDVKEADEWKDKVGQVRDALNTVPDNLDEDVKAQATNLVAEKKHLENQQEEMDDAFEGANQEKIEDINKTLEEITGIKPKPEETEVKAEEPAKKEPPKPKEEKPVEEAKEEEVVLPEAEPTKLDIGALEGRPVEDITEDEYVNEAVSQAKEEEIDIPEKQLEALYRKKFRKVKSRHLQDQAAKEIAEEETEAQTKDLLEEYNEEIQNPSDLSAEERVIAEHGLTAKRGDFIQWGDKNNITQGIAKSYFRKEAQPLDTRAQELSELAGTEITPEDLVNFMLRFPDGRSGRDISARAKEIRKEYQEATGKRLDRRIAKKLLEKYGDEDIELAAEELQDTEVAAIMREFVDEDGNINYDNLSNAIEEEPGFFTVFPFGLSEEQLNKLKEDARTEEGQAFLSTALEETPEFKLEGEGEVPIEEPTTEVGEETPAKEEPVEEEPPEEADEEAELLNEELDSFLEGVGPVKLSTDRRVERSKRYPTGLRKNIVTLKEDSTGSLKTALKNVIQDPTKENADALYDTFTDIYESPFTGSNQAKRLWKEIEGFAPEIKQAQEATSKVRPRKEVIAEQLEKAADNLEGFKAKDVPGMVLAPKIWNAGISAVQTALRAGATMVDAVNAGIAKIKSLLEKEGKSLSWQDQNTFDKHVKAKIQEGADLDAQSTTNPTDEQVTKSFGQQVIDFFNKGIPVLGGLDLIWERKVANKAEEAVAKKMKRAIRSRNTIVRNATQLATNWFNGVPRTRKDEKMKMQMRGRIDKSKALTAKLATQLKELINYDKDSASRVHQVLDPGFYEDRAPLTYDELNDNERALHDVLRKMNQDTHQRNFDLGLINEDTYNEYKDKYIARLYEYYEGLEDLDIPETANTGMITYIYQKRKDINQWKLENRLEDPIYATLVRMRQTEQNASVLAYSNYINSQKGLSKNDKEMAEEKRGEGWSKLSGLRYGELSNQWVPNYIAEDFRGYFYANKAIDALYDFMKGYDKGKVRQFLKKYHTVFTPQVQVGNFFSNYAFAFGAGVDPIRMTKNMPHARKEIKQKGDDYMVLLENGIIGANILKKDLAPATSEFKSLRIEGDRKKFLERADEWAVKTYQSTDDFMKLAAYKSLRDMNYSQDEAVRRVFEGFQNYSTVGKVWDTAAKLPVFGNPYVKFKADLIRLVKNSVTKRPLQSAAFLMTLEAAAHVASYLSGEDEEEREIRESRPFIPKIHTPIGTIPLVFKAGKKEINLARYISPVYEYDTGDDPLVNYLNIISPVEVMSLEGPKMGQELFPVPKTQDVFLGPFMSALVLDTDFRGKPISDPYATRYRESGLSTMEKIVNKSEYISRSVVPLFESGEDFYLTATYGEDYWGRHKSVGDALISRVVKTRTWNVDDYSKVIENKVKNMDYEGRTIAGRIEGINATYKKEKENIDRALEEGKLPKDKYDRKLVKLHDESLERYNKWIGEYVKLQEEVNAYASDKDLPQDIVKKLRQAERKRFPELGKTRSRGGFGGGFKF